MNKHLLVTASDDNMLDKSKQLFYSAFSAGQWKYDFGLLTYSKNQKKLNWFNERGISIIRCPIIGKSKSKFDVAQRPWTSATWNRLYLFTEQFKAWEYVVYLDTDIIIEIPINYMFEAKKSLSAVAYKTLGDCFFPHTIPFLSKAYNLDEPGFMAGVFVIPTKIIKQKTFEELIELKNKYEDWGCRVDESILNLYFYKTFEELDFKYHHTKQSPQIDKAVRHFALSTKPWDKESPYYTIWKENLAKSDSCKFIPSVISRRK